MKSLPNLLSLSRLFFALCLLIPSFRAPCIVLAMLSDVFDGYFARKWQLTSRLGTLLDPVTDKIFVATALTIFFVEDKISILQLAIFLARDISLLVFTIWQTMSCTSWTIRSFFCGKVMTSCQFIALFLLSLNCHVPDLLYALMALFGIGSFFELFFRCKRAKQVS